VWGQGWAKAGIVKSKNMINVFKLVYLLKFQFLVEVKHPLEEENWCRSEGVAQVDLH
jgi:hypothetical protein